MTSLMVLENMKENTNFHQTSELLNYLLSLVTKDYQNVIWKYKYIKLETIVMGFSVFLGYSSISFAYVITYINTTTKRYFRLDYIQRMLKVPWINLKIHLRCAFEFLCINFRRVHFVIAGRVFVDKKGKMYWWLMDTATMHSFLIIVW